MVDFGVSLPTGREGLMVPSGFASRETIVEAGVLAEELGFQSVWGNDHITVQEYRKKIRPKPAFYEPIISLAAVSAVTKKVKLGTGILVLPWRVPTLVVFSKQLATLDVLSGGRVLLGIGTGAYREESAALGIGHRLAMMNEGLRAMRVLFNEDPASYKGKYVKFSGLEFYPRPLQRPFPIYVGRHLTTEKVLRWVARNSHGWIPGLTPDQFAAAMPRLKEYAEEYGRRICDIDVVREISLSHAATREQALENFIISPAQAHYISLSKGKRFIDFDEESKYSLIGTTDDIIRGIQEYLDVGVTHFMFNITVSKPSDLFEGMERFAEDVMPSFL
ncbi:MAG: TIGR03619 family F420-dependent LLM class oxidoreductase [Candidatus Bathyarchaeota archaeon]|nr:MAG: TIGR03619 family F420-dependent LLM class oxidoreductase [Candidatus Bathyarchaeota archaeon]